MKYAILADTLIALATDYKMGNIKDAIFEDFIRCCVKSFDGIELHKLPQGRVVDGMVVDILKEAPK